LPEPKDEFHQPEKKAASILQYWDAGLSKWSVSAQLFACDGACETGDGGYVFDDVAGAKGTDGVAKE
jgi:hypothetical protein